MEPKKEFKRRVDEKINLSLNQPPKNTPEPISKPTPPTEDVASSPPVSKTPPQNNNESKENKSPMKTNLQPKGSFWQRFRKKKWPKVVLIIIAVLGGLGILALAGSFLYFAKDLPSPEKINKRSVAESTKIYDRDEKTLLYEVHGEEKRTVVKLNEISPYLTQATISAEDKQFYKHFGFDPRGIVRSLFKNTTENSKVGGSTITQQFVKNSILSPEKTYTRKIKELILALEIEVKFSKDEILQMYLNEIPYGSNAFGAEAAAKTFLGKSAKDLTIAESAYLASLPNAPTFYSPFGSHTDRLEIRKDWILSEMLNNGYINQDEFEKARVEKVKFKEGDAGIIAAHFVMYVRELLEQKYSEELIKEGGFKVVTTLDMNLQKIAEKTVPEAVGKNKKYNASNAALVSVDPTNGQILAMQGSKDYFDREHDGNVNVCLSLRQPGSSFKPYAYAKAFQKDYTTETILYDVDTEFTYDGRTYRPRNYDGSNHGPVTMRKALAGSLNIPAVKTLYLAGLEDTIKLTEEMGITTLKDRSRFGLSLVLGGGEVKLLEHTAAFGTFAANGKKFETTPILKVIDRNGKVLENNAKKEGKQILEPKVAKMINGILSDTGSRKFVFGGNADNLEVPGYQVAAKTGTTQEWRDAWTVGYSANLVTGVWTGNNNNSEMAKGADGIYVAAPLWKAFMSEAVKTREKKDFDGMEPDKIEKPILRGEVMPEVRVKVHKLTGKLATPQTPPGLVEERTYRSVHCLLYYVEKDNPRGPFPKNPAADPQYKNWESAVQSWAARQGYRFEAPPSEMDDSNSSGKQPKISITSPASGETIYDSTVLVKTSVDAPQGVKNVDFYVDGKKVSGDTGAPYEASVSVANLSSGFHNLTAKVLDQAGNVNDSTISVNIRFENKTPTKISLSVSKSGTVANEDFPLSLAAKVSSGFEIKKVDFFIDGSPFESQDGSGSKTYVSSWPNPGAPRAYQLSASVTDSNGRTVLSNKIIVTVK